MAGFENDVQGGRIKFEELFKSSDDLVKFEEISSLDRILGLGRWHNPKKPFLGSLAKAESLAPRLVKQPKLVRRNKL